MRGGPTPPVAPPFHQFLDPPLTIAMIACLSVCVCVCVCHTPVLYQTAKRSVTQTTPRDSPETLVFWHQESLLDDQPSPWNLCSKWPTPFRTPLFWPISAHSTSTVRASEKSSNSTNRKSTMRFPTSHRWTVYVTSKSPKGWHKTRFCYFFQSISTSVDKSLLQRFFVWKRPATKL